MRTKSGSVRSEVKVTRRGRVYGALRIKNKMETLRVKPLPFEIKVEMIRYLVTKIFVLS